MAKNRVIYQSEALYVSKDASSTGVHHHEQLNRVQSANYSFNISRQDVNQFGQLAKVGSMVLESPTVSMDTSYLVTDGFNERALGFYVSNTTNNTEQSFISGFLADGDGKNFYVTTVPEGQDANGVAVSGATNDVIGIGNAYLSDYSLDLSVGSLPTVSVSFEAANINSTAGNVIETPAVSQASGTKLDGIVGLPTATSGIAGGEIALRPGDVTVDITSFDGQTIVDIDPADTDGAHIQSASLSIPLSRTPLERLGTKFAYARAVDFPVQATLSVNAIVNEVTARNLADVINDESAKTVTLTLKNEEGAAAMTYTIKGAQIVSESFSSSIGANKSVDLTFTTSVGGPDDVTNGVFASGINATAVFT
jgi:hypothetical protein